MIDKLEWSLETIAKSIDANHLQSAEKLQEDVWNYRPVERLPVIIHELTMEEYPAYTVAEIFDDADKMLYNELLQSYIGVKFKDDRMLNVRAQFGPGVIPSMFGCKVTAAETTTWTAPYLDSGKIRRLVEKGMPDIHAALGTQVFERQEYYKEVLGQYGLSEYVHQYQADNQSPFDVAEMIWGEEIYPALYEEPRLVHDFLELLTETTIAFVEKQKRIINEKPSSTYHWWYKINGGVRCVDDMTVNISPDMYEEFVRPYNEKLFGRFGGGYFHYCGFDMHNQNGRINTKGARGMELVEDRFQNNTDHSLLNCWHGMREKQQAICWIGFTLDEQARREIDTGVVFGFFADKNTEAQRQTDKVREFWTF